ncbi:spore coat U domain-containing protein [Rhodanobacter sp. C03]|uniref:Csu type fimbrial protein n=1 Tax=Rhodanobacter sp. C03 TaxID=1945858 RepID=UPI00143A8E47|nr:spore coat U domain-containing protein [Rhodanobacter sp. C03]
MKVKTARRHIAAVCVMASFLCASFLQGAFAGSVSGTLDVRLQLTPSCDFAIGNIDDGLLDFGRAAGGGQLPVDGMSDSRKSAASLSIACSSSYTGANAPVLTVNNGLHAIGSQRYLMGPGSERIAYDLYADPAHRVQLDAIAPLQLVIPNAGVTTVIPIYGRIPRIGNPVAGHYSDVVWLTLSY